MSNSKKKLFKVKTGGGKVGIKGTLTMKHIANWDTKSYTILAILIALLLSFVSLISFGIYELIPLSPWLKVTLAVIAFWALVIIAWRQRYSILMFTRWLDNKFTATKTYHDK